METNNGLSSPKIALLIDFDNVILGIDEPGFDVELVVNALRERGQIVLGRCYGDWYRHNRHRRKLMEQGLELVETPAFGPVIKNSADIRIALDGYEIGMTQQHIDTFCIVSGDSDFLPLIKKLQYLGKNVLVICGNRFTSDMVRRNCNEFIAYENLLAASVGATEDATTIEGAFALLHRAMAALRERGSDIRTSTLKQMMLQLNPVFSERTLGCAQFRGFLDKAVSANIVKLGPRDKVSGELHVLLPEEDEAHITDRVEAKPREEGRTRDEVRTREREKAPERSERAERTSERTSTSERLPDRMARRAGRRAEAESILASMAQESAARTETAATPAAATPTAAPVEATPATATPAPEAATGEEETTDFSEHVLSRGELMSRGLRRGRLKFSGKTGRPETVPVETAEAASAAEARSEVVAALETEQSTVESSEIVLVDVLSAPADALPEGEATEPTPEEIASKATETSEATSEEKPKRPRSRRRSSKKTDDKAVEAVSTETAPTEAAPEVVLAPPAIVEALAALPESITDGEATPATEATSATESVPAAEAKKPTRRRRAPRKKADATDGSNPEGFPTTESSAVVTPDTATPDAL